MPTGADGKLHISRASLLLAGCLLALGILFVLEFLASFLLARYPSMADQWSGSASRSLLAMEKDLNLVAQRQQLYVQDRSLFWRLAPNVEMQVENAALETRGEPLRWTIRTNDDGFRSPSQEAEGTGLRILTMGDSSTFGYRVNADEAYPARLSRACEGAGPGSVAQVFNAGVPGYTSYQGKTLLRSLLARYRPQVVTIAFGNNDHNEDSLADADRGAWLESPVGRVAYAAGRLNLSRLIAGLARAAARPDTGPRTLQGERVNVAAYRANVEEMIALARQHSARVVLMNVTFHAPLYRYVLQELSTRLNVPYLDGTLLFDEMYGRIEQGAAYPEQVKAWLAFYDSEVSAVRQVYFSEEFYKTHYTTEREWRQFVTLMADPIHPNAIGHLVLSDALAPLVCPPGAAGR